MILEMTIASCIIYELICLPLISTAVGSYQRDIHWVSFITFQFSLNLLKNYAAISELIGATGLAQCSELTWQLRGTAGKRQVPNAKLALQHNLGLGGAVVLALYRVGFPSLSKL